MGADRGCSRWPCFRAILDRRSLHPLCVLAGAVGPPCIACGSVVGWELAVSSLHCNRVLYFWWASDQDGRVSRGRFRDLSLRLRCAEHNCAIVALLCVLYRGLLHYVEIPAVQSQPQSPSVENANKKKVHMYAYTS